MSAWGERSRLPDDREGVTHHFAIATGQPAPNDWLDCYISVGLYPKRSCKCIPAKDWCEWCSWPSNKPEPDRVGEIFVKIGKSGDLLAALDQWAVAMSVALQLGAGPELFRKFVGQRFEPAGITRGTEKIRQCSSVVDYVARWVLMRFYEEV